MARRTSAEKYVDVEQIDAQQGRDEELDAGQNAGMPDRMSDRMSDRMLLHRLIPDRKGIKEKRTVTHAYVRTRARSQDLVSRVSIVYNVKSTPHTCNVKSTSDE